MSTPRLTLLLGAGGVGKTTLAAAYALALARAGRNVGLLGIDPSRRLRTALGVELTERAAPLADAPSCRAAILTPAESLRRWAAEACDDDTRARIFGSPFFGVLADRLAAATDVIAAVRAAEWMEQDPSLDELVVDTAPGLNGIEVLRRPRHLAAFLEGDLVRWLRRGEGIGLAALGRLGGARMLGDLADLLRAVDAPIQKMLARVAAARRAIDDSSHLVIVTSVRDDAADAAAAIARALSSVGLAPFATVLNRSVPDALGAELARLAEPARSRDAVLARYAQAYAATQARVARAIAPLAPIHARVPLARGLDEVHRIDALADLGEILRDGLVTRQTSGGG